VKVDILISPDTKYYLIKEREKQGGFLWTTYLVLTKLGSRPNINGIGLWKKQKDIE
jgi:hypothetical protein